MSQGVNVLPDENNTWPTFNQQTNAQTVAGSITSSTAITTTASFNMAVGQFKELSFDVNVSALTGTSPSYTLKIDRVGADGVAYNIYSGSAITTASTISLDLGVGASTNKSFGSTIKVTETIGGTGSPSITRTISVQGK